MIGPKKSGIHIYGDMRLKIEQLNGTKVLVFGPPEAEGATPVPFSLVPGKSAHNFDSKYIDGTPQHVSIQEFPHTNGNNDEGFVVSINGGECRGYIHVEDAYQETLCLEAWREGRRKSRHPEREGFV